MERLLFISCSHSLTLEVPSVHWAPACSILKFNQCLGCCFCKPGFALLDLSLGPCYIPRVPHPHLFPALLFPLEYSEHGKQDQASHKKHFFQKRKQWHPCFAGGFCGHLSRGFPNHYEYTQNNLFKLLILTGLPSPAQRVMAEQPDAFSCSGHSRAKSCLCLCRVQAEVSHMLPLHRHPAR